MKKWLPCMFLFLLGLSSFAQVFQPGNAPSVFFLKDVPDPTAGVVFPQINALPPVVGEVNPELAAVLQYTLDSLTAEYGIVGLSGALQLPGGDIWKGTSGINTISGDTISTDMVLGMGSVTKTFTAAIVMQLMEEGTLSLYDSLHEWLPAYPNIDPGITIRQLLNHTSGIFNYTDSPSFGAFFNQNLNSIIEPEYILENHVPAPSFPAGTSWGYSNTNYLLLGLIIEAATGHEYHAEVRSRLIEPLGLNSMALFPNESPDAPVADLWYDLTGNGVPDQWTGSGISLNGFFSMAWAAGALMTTPEDLTYWVKGLMTGQVVNQSTLDLMMQTTQLAPTFGYGLGLINIKFKGVDWWGHEGSIGYLTLAYYSPELDLSAVLISNATPTEKLGDVYFALIDAYCNFEPLAVGGKLLENSRLTVSPNPFDEGFLLEMDLEKPSPAQLVVSNVLGETVQISSLGNLSQGQNSIHLDGFGKWPTGIYSVQVVGDGWVAVKKVLKQ